ncbi:MAG: hypothetical protein V3V13_11030 [Paracoccaceae bacterium]
MTDTQSGPHHTIPWYLWVVAIIALLWNGFGVILWGGTSFMPNMFLDGFPPEHRAYTSTLPVWSTLTWGLGVLAGALGSLLLLLRKSLAVLIFALSLFGAATNTIVYITNPPPAGFFNLPLTLFIVGFALFLLWFAHLMKRRGVLR